MSARDRIDELLEQLRAQRPMSERSLELLVVELLKCRSEGTVRGGHRSRRGRTEARLPTHPRYRVPRRARARHRLLFEPRDD